MFKTDYLGILATQSTTGNCTAMLEEVNRQLDLIPGLTKETDDYGNLYVTKGKSSTYPAFVSHLDTVHKIYETFTVQETPLNYIFAYSEDEGFQQVGVGGDDKSGIIACLELLTRLKIVKCAFFLDEEQGCKGSSAGRLEFFDDCRYAIQIDRKGGSDIITKGSGTQLCSPEFESFIETLGKNFNYKPTTGATTDVVKLKDRGLKISACNLSAGYYNPHTKQEYIDADELLNCIDFCVAISKIKTVYTHVLPKPKPFVSNTPSSSNATRKCAACNQTLGYGFGIICNECVRNSLSLEVDSDGNATVLQKSLGECKGCELPLYTIEEVSAEYCDACQFCSSCGVSLETNYEFDMAQCTKCSFDNDDDWFICQTVNCTNVLESKTEKIYGFCSRCVVVDGDSLCMLADCDNPLDDELEVINGICKPCMKRIH